MRYSGRYRHLAIRYPINGTRLNPGFEYGNKLDPVPYIIKWLKDGWCDETEDWNHASSGVIQDCKNLAMRAQSQNPALQSATFEFGRVTYPYEILPWMCLEGYRNVNSDDESSCYDDDESWT